MGQKVKARFHDEPLIQDLKDEFELSEEVAVAATLIFRLFLGLGKGLSSSQKRSFSAASVWLAGKLVERREVDKDELAEAADVSTRTLSRRFNDLENSEESKLILEYVKDRVKKWSKRRERRLQDLL